MTSGLFEVATLFFAAALLGFGARLLKQPIILAYIAAGAIVAHLDLLNLAGHSIFDTFADLGIILLLFLVGLEINYTSLRLIGRAALLIGFSQILLTSAFGFLVSVLFGFSIVPALYTGIALAFSSTIIAVKFISEKKDLQSLYGKTCLGILLAQDAVVILILTFLSGLEPGEAVSATHLFFTFVKGIFVFFTLLVLGRRFLPIVFSKISGAHELLFVASLAWVFLTAIIMELVGFSVEIGGFLAGLALANSAEGLHIGGLVKPLRDFFVLIFFTVLGSSLAFLKLDGLVLPALALSVFVLVGNPIIVMGIMGLLGYRKRTGFLTGVSIAQVSEFSLILMAEGAHLGHIGEEFVALITVTAALTFVGSAHIITHSERIFSRLASFLLFFERKTGIETDSPASAKPASVVLVGCHRIGQNIAFCLPKDDLLVIDFNPDVIREMKRHNFNCIFGDIADPEVFERARIGDAKLVISTSPDLMDNLALLARLKKSGTPVKKTVIRAESEKDAKILYRAGASYVLLPHFTSGQYLGKTIIIDPAMRILEKLKERDLAVMRQIHRRV